MDVAIQTKIPAPIRDNAMNTDSEKFNEDRIIKLAKATRVSVNMAKNTIRRLLKNPDCRISVKIAVNTGPGIAPPINPKTNAATKSLLMNVVYQLRNFIL